MKHLKHCLFIFSLICFTADSAAAENYVFAPFVSRLKAVEDNSSIRLTWKDSGNAEGSYIIYRHTEKISRNSFADAFQVAEVKKGVQKYTDAAMAGTDYYYSVLLKNKEGNIFDIFIPYRNVTSNPVSISSIKKIDDNITYITYLNVMEKEDSLYLTFKSSNHERNIAVLRSREPVLTTDDLKKADLLSVVPSDGENYTDFPIAGIPYYYTVVDAELLKSYNMEIIPFENTTITPSEIKITDQAITSLKKSINERQKPLTAVYIDRNIETGRKLLSAYNKFFPEKGLGGKTVSIIKEMTESRISTILMAPELIDSGDFYSQRENIRLSVILDRYFFKKDWKNLEEKLVDFKRSLKTSSLKNRTSFYLGQSYYFQGKKEKAFMEFLSASESYYPESRKWMNNILLSEY